MFALPHGVSLALKVITKEIELLRTKRLTIALDGHSSSGKSTLAKDIARILEIVHVDTGAMYRAVTLYFLRHDISIDNSSKILDALNNITIEFVKNAQGLETFLNGESVEREIREMSVSERVSDVAAISSVRKFCVTQQKSLAESNGVVMDGRDIGTVVFPDADVKFFVTASIDVRSQRRYKELLERGIKITLEEVRKNLISRDEIDSTREDSPLRQAKDAIIIDTSELDRGAMLASALKIIHNRV